MQIGFDNIMSGLIGGLTAAVIGASVNLYISKKNLSDSLDSKSEWRKQLYDSASKSEIKRNDIYRLRTSLRYKAKGKSEVIFTKDFDYMTFLMISFCDNMVSNYNSEEKLNFLDSEITRIYMRYLLKHQWEILNRGKLRRTFWKLMEEKQLVEETLAEIENKKKESLSEHDKRGEQSMIETERLIIRSIEETEADLNALYTLLSDEEVNTYLPWYPVKDLEDTKKFYKTTIEPNYQKQDGYYFVICLKENNLPIGYIAVNGGESHDFGYGLQKEYWGKGLVTEASNAIIDFLKSQGWSYITATHDIHNIGSGKVMEKIGMSYKYSYKEQWQPKNITVTFRMYQMNFDHNQGTIYREYWDKYPEHFIEDL